VLLGELLEEWRHTHDPALDEPIRRLGEAAALSRGPLAAKSKAALEEAWSQLAAIRDVEDVDRLLDTPWPGAFKTALERVKLLETFAPDPRIAEKLARVAATYTSSASHPLHRAIATVLARSPTPAILPALAVVEERRYVADADRGLHDTATLYEPTRRAIAELAVLPADPLLLSRARASVPAARPDARQLFDQHTASPRDLALRAVLADALQSEGDPRGEFIATQLAMAAGTATPAGRKRQAQLLAAHIDAWTGPLPNVPKASRRFEHGFLVEATVNARGAALVGTFDRPEWVTLERLTIDGYETDLRPLLTRMPLLRVFECVHDNVLKLLATGGPYKSIRAVSSKNWLPNERRAFPNLAVLGGTWMRYQYTEQAFARHQAAARALGLDAIAYVHFDDENLAQALSHRSEGPPETRFTFGLRGSGDRGFSAGCWKLKVERDAPRAEASFSGGNDYQRDRTLESILKALGRAGITELVLRAGPSHLTAIARRSEQSRKPRVHLDKGDLDLSRGPRDGADHA
jgi:uncharacterized protein (TIGR02996 family)